MAGLPPDALLGGERYPKGGAFSVNVPVLTHHFIGFQFPCFCGVYLGHLQSAVSVKSRFIPSERVLNANWPVQNPDWPCHRQSVRDIFRYSWIQGLSNVPRVWFVSISQFYYHVGFTLSLGSKVNSAASPQLQGQTRGKEDVLISQ